MVSSSFRTLMDRASLLARRCRRDIAAPSSPRRGPRRHLQVESLESRMVPTYLVGEFTGSGVWRYNDTPPRFCDLPERCWENLSPYHATQVDITHDGHVAAAFSPSTPYPGVGTYLRLQNSGVWELLTPNVANKLAISNFGVPGSTIYVVGQFNGAGVWRWDSVSRTWRPLTFDDATLVDINQSGTVVASFPRAGIWRYRDIAGWEFLTPTPATQLAIDGIGPGDIVASFPGAGIWRLPFLGTWEFLSPVEPVSLDINSAGSVVASFQTYGVWLFDNISTHRWRQISPFTATAVGIADLGRVCGAFDSGVWYDDTFSDRWQFLSPFHPVLLRVG